ncbi:hypothetical protein BV25DRAFT_1921760 [Artomyces pyxidatus]|uniref:Uncharacterized protein n=1 Tax=Artomyces pyxidatus TaxID=48021 RepID=A0ACB8SIJ4_9AGAM|nr:hypothetical protein BV25DRAFT_1921760 [Artomyces pyxidatus]
MFSDLSAPTPAAPAPPSQESYSSGDASPSTSRHTGSAAGQSHAEKPTPTRKKKAKATTTPDASPEASTLKGKAKAAAAASDDFEDSTPATKADLAALQAHIATLMSHVASMVKEGANMDNEGDDEEDVLPITKGRSKRRSTHGFVAEQPGVKRKSPQMLAFQASKSDLAKKMLGRSGDTDPLPPPPTKDEIERFELTGIEEDGPNPCKFQPDYMGKPRSKWNSRLASVFAEVYLDSDFPDEDEDTIIAQFMVHWKTILSHRKSFGTYVTGAHPGWSHEDTVSTKCFTGDAEKTLAEKTRAKRNRQRKRVPAVFGRRMLGLVYHQIVRFIPLLQEVGEASMSGDESEHEMGFRGGLPFYGTEEDPWRSADFVFWLKIMDLLSIAAKFDADGTRASGNWPRLRKPSGIKVEKRAVRALPENLYKSSFISSLSNAAKRDLRPREPVDLSFTKAELELAARYIHVEARRGPITDEKDVNLAELYHWLKTGETLPTSKR